MLETEQEALILECGEPLRKVRKALGYRHDKIVGALITHEHGDHASRCAEYTSAYIPTYATQGTIEALGDRGQGVRAVKLFVEFRLGGFRVKAFSTQHDAREPCGYLIDHSDSGLILFATDTYYIKYQIPGISHALLECNYSEDRLQAGVCSGAIDIARAERTRRSHMSIETCIGYLRKTDQRKLKTIVLLHLSDANSNSKEFASRIESETLANVYVASNDTMITLL